MSAAAKLGLNLVNTFIGRDPSKTVEGNWPLLEVVWRDLVSHAHNANVTLAIENCPMLFTTDEWPGGKKLAVSPLVGRKPLQTFPRPPPAADLNPVHPLWRHTA